MRIQIAMLAMALLSTGLPSRAETPVGRRETRPAAPEIVGRRETRPAAPEIVAWAESTASPRPISGSALGGAAPCPESEDGLESVARALALHRFAANDIDALTYALRAAGEPHVWPRALTLEGRSVDPAEAASRIRRWLATVPRHGHLRCAVARTDTPAGQTVAAVAVDAQADLEPIPMVARPSSWVDIDARVLVPASKAKVLVLGPTGPPLSVPTSFEGRRVRARANVDRPGAWLVQVVVDGDNGPRPVLEARVFAGISPPSNRPLELAPGENQGSPDDPDGALAAMVTASRASAGLTSLATSITLDRVASEHTERMMRAAELGHDVGDGDARRRVEDAGFVASEIGENVAHAATLALAHRALWASPSHRDNILGARYARIGVGIRSDTDGTVWVTEVFATAH